VVLIQPQARDLDAMGGNLMSRSRRHEVIEVAAASVRAQLRRPRLRQALRDLPAGDPARITQPAGPASTWPRFVATAERRTA